MAGTVPAPPVSQYGDGNKVGNEICDDGNTETETEGDYGTENCSACNATCSATWHSPVGFVGMIPRS